MAKKPEAKPKEAPKPAKSGEKAGAKKAAQKNKVCMREKGGRVVFPFFTLIL